MKIKFPTAHTVLLIIAALVAISTYFIPAGKYETLSYDKDKEIFVHHFGEEQTQNYPAEQQTLEKFNINIQVDKFTGGDIRKPIGIPNTYKEVNSTPQDIQAFIKSPIKGMMGAMDVILFVLIIGGFIGVVNYSKAFDIGINALAKNMKGREILLIIIVASLISLGGTTFGLAEETIAFYPILIPIFLAAGYDAIVALAAIYLGSCVGTMISTVNPFSAIIASDAAGIDFSKALNNRISALILAMVITLIYIIRYAERVRQNPELSLTADQNEAIAQKYLKQDTEQLEFTRRIGNILLLFLACFVTMVYGVFKLEWWFEEMTAVFLVGSIAIGVVARISEKNFVDAFVAGANDLLSVALIIGLARGITVIMDDGQISDTLLFYASGAVDGMPKILFANVMLFLFAGLSFFIPSSSGLAVLSMPIMAPIADVVGVPREVVVDAYQYGMGLMAFITPTGLILASLTMVDISYDKWLKFVMPLLIILTIFSMAWMSIGLMI